MSLLKITNEFLLDCRVKPLMFAYFDRIDMVDTIDSDDVTTFRVEKIDLGLVYDADDQIDLQVREVPTTVIPAHTEKCQLIISSINGVSLDGIGVNPKQKACITEQHRSQGSGKGVKSKG